MMLRKNLNRGLKRIHMKRLGKNRNKKSEEMRKEENEHMKMEEKEAVRQLQEVELNTKSLQNSKN